MSDFWLRLGIAQRYKNTLTITDAKARKHAFQTIINDYRSLSDYFRAVYVEFILPFASYASTISPLLNVSYSAVKY